MSLAAATMSVAVSCVKPGAGAGTVQGHVTAGPTCPVESFPPDPQCADRPVVDALVQVVGIASVASTRTDRDGFYSLSVPAGVALTVQVGTGSRFPVCPPVQVTVAAGQTLTRDVGCDTGIR